MNDLEKNNLINELEKTLQEIDIDSEVIRKFLQLVVIARVELFKRKSLEGAKRRAEIMFDIVAPQWEGKSKDDVIKALVDAGELFKLIKHQVEIVLNSAECAEGMVSNDGQATDVFNQIMKLNDLLMSPEERMAQADAI